MAQFLSIDEARAYSLSNGATVDLIACVSTAIVDVRYRRPDGVNGVKVGDSAYVHAMGSYRRGVVSNVTRTKIAVTFTTQGAIDDLNRGNRSKLRIQTTTSDPQYVLTIRG